MQFLDSNFKQVKNFIYKTLIEPNLIFKNINFKGDLIELCSKLNYKKPIFELIEKIIYLMKIMKLILKLF